MEANVREYEIQLSQSSVSWVKRVFWFCAIVEFAFCLRWIGDSILHSPHGPLIQSLFMPVVVATVLVFGSFKRFHPRMTITIGDNFIESRMRASWFRYKKRIRREQIKSISENRHGLRLMDRGKFGSRMLGFIFIPATMPEYQEIRSELARWAPLKANN
jgi:hypothetical protein